MTVAAAETVGDRPRRTSLGIGIVGVGAMGSTHAKTIVDAVAGADLVALSDLDLDRATELAQSLGVAAVYGNASELIADPSVGAVLIASTAATHDELVLACLEAGKPTFCEKPLSTTVAGSLRVVEAEAALGARLVQVGFMRRYDAGYRELKRLLDEGEVGSPLLAHCAHRNPAVPDFVTAEMALTESVVHEVDVMRWLLGEEIVAVTVLTPRPTWNAPAGTRDTLLILFETEGGVLVDVESFLRARYSYHVRCEVVGETGTLSLPGPTTLRVARDGRESVLLPPGFDRWAQAYRDELQAWVTGIHEGRVEGPGTWDGYAASAVMDASLQALASGERTEVSLAPRPAPAAGR
jgi:myo-inositol 2-dehydrogenase / D-chiro-inositol 1-dehydrogenase